MAGQWQYSFKFIITGDAAVGKSSLLVRLTDQRFLVNPDSTIGVEFGSKLITLPENKIVKLQCWDTAGTESFKSITRSYYRGAAGCLLVYDVTNRQSFENIRQWLADVREHADPHVSCILVGNKVDLCEPTHAQNDTSAPSLSSLPPAGSQTKSTKSTKGKARAVSYDVAEGFAKAEGLLFVEASAKSGLNVEQAFVDASLDILEKIKKGVFDDSRSPGVKLSKPNSTTEGQASKPCCAS